MWERKCKIISNFMLHIFLKLRRMISFPSLPCIISEGYCTAVLFLRDLSCSPKYIPELSVLEESMCHINYALSSSLLLLSCLVFTCWFEEKVGPSAGLF